MDNLNPDQATLQVEGPGPKVYLLPNSKITAVNRATGEPLDDYTVVIIDNILTVIKRPQIKTGEH